MAEIWIAIEKLGNVASIVALALTIYVFFGIRRIKQEFLFRIRLPDLLKKLQGHASTISTELPNLPKSKETILEELALSQVNIQSLEDKSTGHMKHSLKKLRSNVENLRQTQDFNKDAIRGIYLEMNMVIQQISNVKEDDKWRQGNG